MAERLVRQPDEVERRQLARTLGISYKRLHGWEPRTLQRGYDRDGQPCRLADAWEVVTDTEPEWDDQQRQMMLVLPRYEAKVCECGFHESLTDDDSLYFTFPTRTCPVCKGAAQMARRLDAQDEKYIKTLGENPPPETPRPGDGRRVAIKLMTPDEVDAHQSSSTRRRSSRGGAQ